MNSNTLHSNLPLVSVIVPSYNHAAYIEDCILSIVNQTYKNIELIVIDDGSKDNSREILERLQKQYGFILEFQENMGLSRTLNKAREKYVHGKYITGSGSDDYLSLDKIEKQVDFLENHPEYGMVCGKIHLVDDEGKLIEGLRIIDPVIDPVESLKFESLLENDCIPSSSVMIRTEIMDACGGYNEHTITEDFDLFLKVAWISKIAYMDEYFACYRWHGQNMTTNTLKMYTASWEIIYSWKDKMDPDLFKKVISRRSSLNFSVLARKHKKEALRYFEFNPPYRDGFILKNHLKGFYKLCFCWFSGKSVWK